MDLKVTLDTLIKNQQAVIEKATNLSSQLNKANSEISEYNGAIQIIQQQLKELEDPNKINAAEELKTVSTEIVN